MMFNKGQQVIINRKGENKGKIGIVVKQDRYDSELYEVEHEYRNTGRKVTFYYLESELEAKQL